VLKDEVRRRISDKIVQGPHGRHIGLSLDSADEDLCVVRLAHSPVVMNTNGIVNGGATAALIDAAGTAAAWASNRVNERSRGTTVGFTTNFLAPGLEGDLLAEARVIRRGGTLSVVTVEVRDTARREVASALVTYKLDLRD
jgi:uncharacterized protein (TIGR00369 family)